jgi:hypothetical protein
MFVSLRLSTFLTLMLIASHLLPRPARGYESPLPGQKSMHIVSLRLSTFLTLVLVRRPPSADVICHFLPDVKSRDHRAFDGVGERVDRGDRARGAACSAGLRVNRGYSEDVAGSAAR